MVSGRVVSGREILDAKQKKLREEEEEEEEEEEAVEKEEEEGEWESFAVAEFGAEHMAQSNFNVLLL